MKEALARRFRPRSRLVAGLLAGALASSCLKLPPGYEGDYSEFYAAREAAEAARAERERLREEERAAAQAAPVEEPVPVAPEDEGATPFVPVLPPAEGSQARPDDEISRDVREELARTTLLEGRRLAVTVEAGIVTLEGIVLNASEAIAAVFAAGKVDGVRGVYDLLDLEPREEVGAERSISSAEFFSLNSDELVRKLQWTDLDIERAIEGYFARTPELDTSDIVVHVEGGLVILSGRVSSARDRKDAAAIARKVGGRGVRNEIQVYPAFEAPRALPKSPL